MTIKPCPRYEPDLSAFLDGEASPARRVEIESHLRSCDACRAALAQLRGVSRALRRWDAQETRYATSSAFKSRVLSKVGAESEPVDAASAPALGAAWRIAAGVALVAAGATGFAIVARRLPSDRNDDVARLADDVARLERRLGVRPAAPDARSDAGAAATGEVGRVAPFGSVVSPLVADDAPAAPETPPEVYAQIGDRRFVHDALVDHEEYAREKDKLGLLEELRRFQESQSAKATEPNRATQAPPAPSPLANFLAEVRVSSGAFAPYENVQVWPIEATGLRAGDGARVVACETAIAQEILRVTESSSRESVVVENAKGKRPVLILAGDVLVGGRQDRMAREDALVAPGEQALIPTYGSGAERARTSYKSFNCTGIAPQALRALVAADRALLATRLGQDRFDAFVADTVRSLASPRDRGSLDNLFSNSLLVDKTDQYARKLEKRLDPPNVVGFAVSAGSRLLGVEVFGDHATFIDHRARLLRSYMLAAFAASPDGTRLDGTPSRDVVVAALAVAPRGVFHPGTPSGLGTLAVFRGVENGPFGVGLLDGGHVVHASIFTSVPEGPTEPPAAHGGGSHRGAGDAPSGPEGGRGGSTRGGTSEGGEGATDSSK